MTPCALPQALPISCKDCPAFQRLHMSFRCCSESLNRLLNVINTTFKEMTYSRWCCIDRLSRHVLPVTGSFPSGPQKPFTANPVCRVGSSVIPVQTGAVQWLYWQLQPLACDSTIVPWPMNR